MANADLSGCVKVAFASGPQSLNGRLIGEMQQLHPELPLYVVSEFAPESGRWIPYHPLWSFRENLSRCIAEFRGKRIRYAGVLLVPRAPYLRMRLIALLLAPGAFMGFNENLNHFMLRPRSGFAIARHIAWRAKSAIRYQLRPGGDVYTFFWRMPRPREWRRPLAFLAATLAGRVAAWTKKFGPAAPAPAGLAAKPGEEGISVVIPSRNGKELLSTLLPQLVVELEGLPSEIIVVDNGSEDDTSGFLRACYPQVVLESSETPLSFARAVNTGIRRARCSHVCLLNNDMALERGFFVALRQAFNAVPDLFCATAQILFPPGARREETGKAVMPAARLGPTDFPVRCDLPVAGEDLSYVLYGSGGCSLYSREKLLQLGGLGEVYEPAYVEDLDAGYRAWLRGWPTVFCASARVVHRHRATTSRYFSAEELNRCLEVNYLRFLARSIGSPGVFSKLWREAIWRLSVRAVGGDAASLAALEEARYAPGWVEPPAGSRLPDEIVLGLGSGAVSVFPGRPARGLPVVLVASPWLPYPLSHGGAVRIFNLLRRAAADYDLVLVAFTDREAPPRAEVLEICSEVVTVRRLGNHARLRTERPDEVEEFDSPAFRGALLQTIRKWRPRVAQLELTVMAQYARDCAPARTILVEHDITFDLQQQIVREQGDWAARQEHPRWVSFETAAWQAVDCVVTMSEKDRRRIVGTRAVCLPNGVDLERFRPGAGSPDPGRLLFIGSFAHLPNLLAVDFFVREAWPALAHLAPTLHIIAGANPQYYLQHHRDRVTVDPDQPGVELEAFVPDVRPAYERAEIVIVPLPVSAGTNIKVLEALAMGKAVVSTPAGINGLDLRPGRDVLVAGNAREFAAAVELLLRDSARRAAMERNARAGVERKYDWNAIASQQCRLYREMDSGNGWSLQG
jgi:GT2 family glycosyltransferase/glycosyltransferase involved in cell wall biosynthesis